MVRDAQLKRFLPVQFFCGHDLRLERGLGFGLGKIILESWSRPQAVIFGLHLCEL